MKTNTPLNWDMVIYYATVAVVAFCVIYAGLMACSG